MALKPELIVRQLVDFGLSDKEAMIYVTLLMMRKARAGEVARELQLNRMLVYRTMAKLGERALVKATVEKPMRFVPIPMDDALRLLIKDTESRLSQMKYRYDALLQEWSAVDTSPSPADTLSFRVVQGRKQIYALLVKMFRSAEKWIKLIVNSRDLIMFQYVDVEDLLRKTAKKGVKIQIIVQYGSDKLDIVANYVNFAEVRLIPMTRAARLFIVDSRELAIAFDSEESMTLNTREDTCLYIESAEGKSLMTLTGMFSNIWESADDFDTAHSTMPAENVKILRDEESFEETLKDMLGRATSEIMIGIPKGVLSSTKDKLLQLAVNRPGQAYVRLDLCIESSDLQKLEKLAGQIDVYHTDKLQNVQFVIVDRKEILLTLYLGGSEKSARRKHVWSNSRTWLEFVTSFMTDIWQKSLMADTRINELRERGTAMKWLSEVKSVLEQFDWDVHVPGRVTSKKGEKFEFGLLAEDDRGNKIAVEFIAGGNDGNLETITSFYGKAMQCDAKALFLVSVPPAKLEERSLAQYYNIRILEGKNRQEVSSQISEIGERAYPIAR